jgi:uncharacterized membrane protein
MFKENIPIEAPIAAVWAYLSQTDRMPAWIPGIQSMRSVDDQTLRAGSRVIFTAGGKERETEVIECETERRRLPCGLARARSRQSIAMSCIPLKAVSRLP